jgi:polyisoprenoid-binding protein YceI
MTPRLAENRGPSPISVPYFREMVVCPRFAAAMKLSARLLVPLLLLAACSAGGPPPVTAPADSGPWYRAAAAAGTAVYAVDPNASLVTITVRRGGPLARLGHDHVVASHTVSGFAAPTAGRADIHFRADRLSVDEPALRREAGLATEPSAQAIEGTRTNMLDRVLEAGRFPVITVQARQAADGKLGATITLHGVSRDVALPASVESGNGQVTASGALSLRQSDFGITPFAVAGGLLSVQDEIEIGYRIVARRWDGR